MGIQVSYQLRLYRFRIGSMSSQKHFKGPKDVLLFFGGELLVVYLHQAVEHGCSISAGTMPSKRQNCLHFLSGIWLGQGLTLPGSHRLMLQNQSCSVLHIAIFMTKLGPCLVYPFCRSACPMILLQFSTNLCLLWKICLCHRNIGI